ncbi:MAG: hypothetical protein CSB01_00635 [Bacteroidia bacterium]|nr:MAG: hypothetical protein CSB01_00635 [Bacteroidia bacterium]
MSKKNPDKRAKELINSMDDEFKKRKITIAVGNTKKNISLVGTSDKYMPKDILAAMTENEIVATPNDGKHAEEDIVIEAEKRDLTVTEIGASRPICLDCEKLLKAKNIKAKTEFSGKKSKKRRTKQ